MKKVSYILYCFAVIVVLGSCNEEDSLMNQINQQAVQDESNLQSNASALGNGVTTVNGWYEEEEIYYSDLGVEEGILERGVNQIYLIGGAPRLHQANVVLFIPGEAGYSPHWNVNLVHTVEGVTVNDILASPYASSHFGDEGVLFDDVEDILGAADAGLVYIVKPGVVVLCPIISEKGAEAPGNNELPEVFEPFDLDGGF